MPVPRPPHPPHPPRQRTLLLVDDEVHILAALKRLFRRDGYRLLTATSGGEALALLAVNPVDVIVSDQRMPGMTGVDFLRRTKALHPHTVRITLSGFTDLQSIIDAVNEGAVYKFLTKPWDDERLRGHVAQAFAHKEMADDNRRLQGEVAGANADLAALNQRLEQLLDGQRAQSALMQAGADSVRALVDTLPAAVIGIAPDGLLAYLNQRAADLLPGAAAGLGGAPGAQITALLASLPAGAADGSGPGQQVLVDGQPQQAWLRRLSDGDTDRGLVLVLLPCAQAPT
jgi:FixJ family two-component response regulator